MGFLVKILWQTVAIAAVQRAVNYGIKRYTKAPADQLFTLTVAGPTGSMVHGTTTARAATADELVDHMIDARVHDRSFTLLVKREGELNRLVTEHVFNG